LQVVELAVEAFPGDTKAVEVVREVSSNLPFL
jgi:hypothetical protein